MSARVETALRVLRKELYGINFAVTYMCNHRCKTCNIWRVYSQEPGALSGELTTSEVSTMVEKLPSSIMYVQLTGGEPTLRNDLSEIVKRLCTRKSLASVGMPTNGFVPSRIESQVAEVLGSEEWGRSKTRWTISVSVDGLREAHDKLRGVEGAFDNAMKTYDILSQIAETESRIDVSVGVTVSSLNLSEVMPFLRHLKEGNFKYGATFALDSDYYRLDGNSISPTSHSEAEFLMRNLDEFATSMSYTSVRYLWGLSKYLSNTEKQVMPCSALLSQCTIDPYGNVKPCIPWECLVGNLREFDYDLTELLKSRRAREKRREIAGGKCPNCWTICEAAYTITTNTFRNPANLAGGLCNYFAMLPSLQMKTGSR